METGFITGIALVFCSALSVSYTYSSLHSTSIRGNQRVRLIIHSLGIIAASWSLLWALLSFSNDARFAEVFFAGGILAFDLYIVGFTFLTGHFCHLKSRSYTFLIIVGILVAFVDFFVYGANPKIHSFITIRGRTAYTTSLCPEALLHFIFVAFYALLIVITSFANAKKSKLNRHRNYVRNVCLVHLFACVTAVPDSVLPILGYPSFPGSGFGITFAFILLSYMTRKGNAFSISQDSIFEALYDKSEIMILVMDENGLIQESNPAAKKIFGLTHVNGAYLSDILKCSGPSVIQDILSGEEITEHVRSVATDISLHVHSTVYKDNYGAKYGVILLATDATAEEKIIEQTITIEKEKEKVLRIKKMSDQIVETLSTTIDAKDQYTKGHSARVAKYSIMLGEKLGMNDDELLQLEYAALLHDVGKIGIPDGIINKTSTLTDDEYEIIKAHSEIGGKILSNITEIPSLMVGARWHHERYDGTGYPDGKRGTETDLIARIIGVADSYDAMTSNRSYRKYLDQKTVRNEIEKFKGIQFDPVIADLMLEIIDSDPEYKYRENS